MSDIETVSEDLNNLKIQTKTSVFLKTIRTGFHLIYLVISLVTGIFGITICIQITDKQSENVYISNVKLFSSLYVTNWNYLFQTIFLFLALAHDALEWASKQDSKIGKRVRYWRDVLFSALVVPYTCFVFTMFWSLYAIDRELVFPKVYDAVVPWWFNHCVHTNILAMVVLETILQPRRYPTDRRLELILNGGVGILYAIVYYSIYFFAGRWLYNVFGIMTWWQVCLFQIMIWTSSYIFYEIQFPINRLIHGKEPEPQKPVQNSAENSVNNGDIKQTHEGHGDAHQDGGAKQNGRSEKNGAQNTNADLKVPPFSTRSWSLKYRSIRDQFENSKL